MSQAKLSKVAVGTKFVKVFGEDGSKGMEFLDENTELQNRIKENKWTRWDGIEGTAQEHAQWVLNELRSWTNEERAGGFRRYGEKGRCTYYVREKQMGTASLKSRAP